MKQKVVIFLTIAFFLLLLCFPEQVFQGASSGLLLWFHTMLPTLLPFFITTNFLMETSALELLCWLIHPICSRIFHVSKEGSFAVFAGFLCGYPMGSKITATLVKQQKISLAEGNYLLSFCNNTSPMFLISFVLFQCLDTAYNPYPCFCLCMLAPILCSQLFYYCYYKKRICESNRSVCLESISYATQPSFSGNLIDSCIMNSFEVITKIGGYMMLFSILRELSLMIFEEQSWFHYILIASFELTNGVSGISQSRLPMNLMLLLCLSHAAFGGWCAVAQTSSMIQGSRLRLFPYIIEKLVTSLVTSLLISLYLYFLQLH